MAVVVDTCVHCGQKIMRIGNGDWLHYQDGNRYCGKYPHTVSARPGRGHEERAHARSTDPVTSHEAAASVTALTEKQEAVLRLLGRVGPSTDEEIVRTYTKWWANGMTEDYPHQSESGLRTRRSELVRKGKVRARGHKVKPSGRKAIVWEAVQPS